MALQQGLPAAAMRPVVHFLPRDTATSPSVHTAGVACPCHRCFFRPGRGHPLGLQPGSPEPVESGGSACGVAGVCLAARPPPRCVTSSYWLTLSGPLSPLPKPEGTTARTSEGLVRSAATQPGTAACGYS